MICPQLPCGVVASACVREPGSVLPGEGVALQQRR